MKLNIISFRYLLNLILINFIITSHWFLYGQSNNSDGQKITISGSSIPTEPYEINCAGTYNLN